MFSTGFNSGARAGSSTSVRLSGTTRSLARGHPARSISMTPHGLREPRLVRLPLDAGSWPACRIGAAPGPRPCPPGGRSLRRCRPNSSADRAGRGAGCLVGPSGARSCSSGPRAPRPATIVLWGSRSGGPPGSLPRWPGGFFKSLQRLRVLGIVTGASRELAIAERAQFPAQGRLADRDPKLLPDPHCEILQPPANHAMDRRRRAVLNHLCHGLALAVVQLAGVPRGLAVDQAFRTARVEPHKGGRSGTSSASKSTKRSRRSCRRSCVSWACLSSKPLLALLLRGPQRWRSDTSRTSPWDHAFCRPQE